MIRSGDGETLTHINIVLTAGVIVLIYSSIISIYNVVFHPLRKIPGPFLNRISKLPWLLSWISGSFHRSLLQLHEEYGPVVRTAPNEVSFISDAAHQQIYSTESIIRDPERFAKFIKGEQEIINYDHEKDHRRFRKAFHQSLNGTPLLAHESVIRENCSIFRTKVEKYVQENDGRVDITKLYSWLAFDIAGDLIWREPFDCLKNMKSHPWLAAIELASIGTYVLLVGISPLLQKTIWPFIPKRVLDYPRAIVQEKSKTNLASKAHETESAFSFAYRRGILSPEEMEANLIVLVTASSETIHSALLAATGFLGRYKACGRKAREEVRAAFTREEDIVHPAVTELPYLNAVMLETFRLCPAQPTSGPRRVVSDSVTIEGEYIPKGTILRTPQYCAGRYSQYFRDPHGFHPERWLNNPLFTSDQLNVVRPFLSGRQSCPGKQVAEMELAHILARMLWAFDWEVEGESWNISTWKSNIVWDKPSVNIKLIPQRRD
ncbi:cytochrome P450 [Aspergillus japonicus CBS 114.51]|uniref:Cytochrome P450 n=1 Tax=Aspergillus japonicus CBS 114.51 TaxID=1448312 RepID=A0A8T8X8M8_ASPJA|nr:cytochrome P450 [Aspergillus japonicus CBS 114.51]RAH84375.1 cytochrome P450 [Aspergillus japonicus CBS 114.51]